MAPLPRGDGAWSSGRAGGSRGSAGPGGPGHVEGAGCVGAARERSWGLSSISSSSVFCFDSTHSVSRQTRVRGAGRRGIWTGAAGIFTLQCSVKPHCRAGDAAQGGPAARSVRWGHRPGRPLESRANPQVHGDKPCITALEAKPGAGPTAPTPLLCLSLLCDLRRVA